MAKKTTSSKRAQIAGQAGLLHGENTERVSFRAPKALLEAAKRETGIDDVAELGLVALAMLVKADPLARFLKQASGALGPDHRLDY